MRIEPEFRSFMNERGVIVAADNFVEPEWISDFRTAIDAVPTLRGNPALAVDAQTQLLTNPNAGIPLFLSNIVDPQVVRILTAPTRAAEIYGETKKGDWTTTSTYFPFIEPTGYTTSYGDWNNDGAAGANVNWLARQSYLFQTVVQWGEHELARYGLAGIQYATEIEIAAAIAITKFMNKTYFFGVAGLQNYGMLNDPNMIASISPTTKTAGGTTWAAGTAQENFNDINKAFAQLVTQMGGWVVDNNTAMTLVIPPAQLPNLNKVSSFNVSAMTTIMQTFPNLTIQTAPELATQAGNVLQLFIKNYQGVETSYGAYTEKMRNHAVVTEMSGWKQKKSAGTWGAINRRPIAFVTMLGI